MINKTHYDYIIAGAGLSGLSLAHRLINSPLASKKILVIDQTLEPVNDKTWSFWYTGTPPFQNLIYKSWSQVKVAFQEQLILQQIEQYTYHSIKSRAFYKAVLGELNDASSVDLKEESVISMDSSNGKATLRTGTETYTASYIFQSCFTPPALQKDAARYPLIQHFLGWEVETNDAVFNASTITLMDFDPNFEEGIAFIYILPQSPTRAMLEYTIFSDEVKPKAFYEEKLNIYFHNKFNLRPLDYRTLRTEYGEIPMQDHRYAPRYAPRIINMGTVGGLTKPSTGYTFARIQKHAEAITESLLKKNEPALPHRSSFRYRAYDLWLLQIIHDHPAQAMDIFQQLFSNNSMDEVFRFLAEENTLLQDFKTMSKVSYAPFFRAMWETKRRLLQL